MFKNTIDKTFGVTFFKPDLKSIWNLVVHVLRQIDTQVEKLGRLWALFWRKTDNVI